MSDDALRRATASLLDVVQELAQGLAAGQQPESDWADVVVDTFDKHRRELRGEDVEWDDGDKLACPECGTPVTSLGPCEECGYE